MKSVSLLERLAAGVTFSVDSPFIGLHPVTKLAVPVLVFLGVLVTPSLLILGVTLALTAGLFLSSRAGLKELFRVSLQTAPLLILIALIRIFFVPAGDEHVVARLGGFSVTAGTLAAAGASVLRLLDLVLFINLAGRFIDIEDIVEGTRTLLLPLSKLGVSPAAPTLTLTIMFRFVPILAGEADRLMKAQAARGADFAERSVNPLKRIRAYLPLLVPLFLSALRRAETLTLAMEARAFSGGRGGTVRKTAKPGRGDAAAFVLLAVWLLWILLWL